MQETTRDPPHLLRLNSGYQILTREYLAFRSNLPMLYKTIESQLSVPLLSTKMYSNLLITDEVKHEVTVGDPQRSIQRLLDALGAQISNNEAHFYTFLNILQQKPALEDCCTKLLEKCRQLEPIRGKYSNTNSHNIENMITLNTFVLLYRICCPSHPP